jgi:16S rRNA (uracil1498-N3)-methyltransferase
VTPGLEERRRAAAQVFVDDLDSPLLDPVDAHHLARSLRLRPGEAVVASDGAGTWRRCRYTGGPTLDPDGEVEVEGSREPELTVGMSLVKGDRLDGVVHKLTELGVDRVLVVQAERSVVRWDGDRVERHLARLGRVAREAAMQSRQVRLPVVAFAASVAEAERMLGGAGLALAEPGGAPVSLARPAVLVGPEGGWTPDELGRAVARVGLPGGVLRADTAAVAAGVLLTTLRERISAPGVM